MSKESSISVAVRVRPFTSNENRNLIDPVPQDAFAAPEALFKPQSSTTPHGIRKILNVVDDRMLIFDPSDTNPLQQMQKSVFPRSTLRMREHRFVFDRLFDSETVQEDIFIQTTKPLLDLVLDGYNATVFAYGATGCGKTYTILGTPDQPGIIFRTMEDLFQRIGALLDSKTFEVTLSFLEIYNETIRDLLCPDTPVKKLVLREDSQNRILVANLSCRSPSNVEEVMEMIVLGNSNRTSSPTEANATSSRSHAVLQINVVQKNRSVELTEEQTFATLSIIDLAGSERAAATRNRGVRLHEGANINRSLLALGNCINALCDPRRHNHVPYRNLKLTRLLKFSLGGNCKTVMIVCVLPLSEHYDETLNTLKYANRAKEIKTKVIRNQHNLDRHVGSYLKMITQQKQEIEELRARESIMVDNCKAQVLKDSQRCVSRLLEEANLMATSLAKQTSPKKRKVHLLIKRKILLLYRHEVKDWLRQAEDKESTEVLDLCDQLLLEISAQVALTEKNYQKHLEIDYILSDVGAKVLKTLQEETGWLVEHTNIFQRLINSFRDGHEREILFESSVMIDFLLTKLPSYSLAGTKDLKKALIQRLVDLSNNSLDKIVETYTQDFMKQSYHDPPAKRNLSPERQRPNKMSRSIHSERNNAEESFDDTTVARSDEEDDNDGYDEGNSRINQSELDLLFNPSIDLPPDKKKPDSLKLPTNILIKRFLSEATEKSSFNNGLLNRTGANRLEMNAPCSPLHNMHPIRLPYNAEASSVSSGSDILD